jgi:hypothetical protein
MKESAFSYKVTQKLDEFGKMQNIQKSSGWNESLMNKLASAKPSSASYLTSSGFGVLILFIVLINLGFIFNSVINKSNQTSYKERDMQAISEELLINPISIKN